MPSGVRAPGVVGAVLVNTVPPRLGSGLEDVLDHLLRLGLAGERLQALGLRGQLVVLRGEQVVEIADRLEEDVQAGLALHRPEDAAVLEPGVGEDAVEPPEDVDEVLDADVLAVRVAKDDEAAWEELLVRHDVGGPVQGVAAVVDRAAALGLFVDGTEELPLGGSHLRAGVGAAWRGVKEEADDEGVALGYEKSA